ncbi:MAG: hypothetical protein A3B13_02725 [Candidatus Liptonbacteria bacterium RIFCSPLOWO2_01_FULL_45_15]|uniref:Uncharacterized protein n=1 Tax=Candidatus Liptonbacteria bacterium RIFCSPLOWO2_01_FULL_45_15 TaxID=1798649 RepID=A0A1G2CJL8_9BACT|nr:MAG: hypothetical protein A3B13_02725 [Candidatus Liptonbacteria bacterium RIFCSPLOWO2_01_FULL_45_15]
MNSKLKAKAVEVLARFPEDNIRKIEVCGVVAGISAGAVVVLTTGDAFIGLITAGAVFCWFIARAVSAAGYSDG